MHLVGFTIGLYYDARTYKRQIRFILNFPFALSLLGPNIFLNTLQFTFFHGTKKTTLYIENKQVVKRLTQKMVTQETRINTEAYLTPGTDRIS